jgi:SAM-dependent methyltransferase
VLTTAVKLRALDALDRVRGRADPLIPPRRLQYVGAGDFAAVGDEFLGHLVELAGLRPDSDVLDVACGIGRIARALAGHLTTGTYAGFDVNAGAIAWCQDRYPPGRFAFRAVDVRNGRYHPAGTQDARALRFPYADDSFDVAVMTSVITHLVAGDAAHYLAESRRVLRPGGRLLVTCLLLDDASRAAIAAGRAALPFPDAAGEMALLRADVPEDAVAYDERWIRAHADVASIHHGTWRGAPGRSFQDIVIACA